MSSKWRILVSLVVLALLAAGMTVWAVRGPGPLAFAGGPKVALADYRGANPTGAPPSLAKASAAERGEYLAHAADCVVCHTAAGGKEYTGGLGLQLPFGMLYFTNNTPDKENRTRKYNDQEFPKTLQPRRPRRGATARCCIRP